jgi:hypothetical protein
MTPYVEWVKSTLKRGCEIELGPKTVIVGPNAAGKTTIIQSIELATCGHVSDMEGRERVKQLAALGRLFPEDVDISSECRLSDGSIFSWTMDRKKDGFKEPSHRASGSNQTVKWPIQELKATLTGDAGTVAAWLEQQVMGELSVADFLKPLPPEVQDDVKKLLKKIGKTDFMNLAKVAKDEARRLRAEATRSEKTIEQMMVGVAPALSEEDKTQFQVQLEALVAAGGRGITQESFSASRSRLDVEVEEFIQLTAELQSLSPLGAEIGSVVQRLTTALRMCETHLGTFGQDSCWVCGQGARMEIEAQLTRLIEAKGVLQVHLDAKDRRDQLVIRCSALELNLQRLAETFRSAVVVEDVSGQIAEIRARLASDEAAQKTWRNAAAVRLEMAQMRARADHLTTASKALAVAGKDLLEQKKRTFEDSVSSFLPAGERIGVDLASSRVGLIEKGQLHSALSGSEWSRVLLALASVGIGNEETPCVLAPDDRAWDAETLGKAMKALAASPAQILIMSTVKPPQVEGWTVVNLGT